MRSTSCLLERIVARLQVAPKRPMQGVGVVGEESAPRTCREYMYMDTILGAVHGGRHCPEFFGTFVAHREAPDRAASAVDHDGAPRITPRESPVGGVGVRDVHFKV